MGELIPLRRAIDTVGPDTYRWFCWRCQRSAPRTCRRQKTAIRQLDRHMKDVHDYY